MGATLSTDWMYRGLRTLILENEDLRATILLDYGAKIFEFRLKKFDTDLLYHNPRVEIRRPVYGVNVDNWWHGGIDECIPTGQASQYKGEEYPYLGEVWSMPWNYEVDTETPEEITVHLWRPTVIAPLLVERWMTIHSREAIVEMKHKISNTGYLDFQFLWGIHPGLAINPNTRIDIPASKVIIDESSPNNRLGPRGETYDWPYAKTADGKTVDMRLVQPAESKTVDMHYATGLQEGWLAVTDTSTRIGFGLTFPKDIFKCIWLWLVYGGWRGLYCAAVEAWTGYPGALDLAVKNGTYASLNSGEKLSCETRLVGYTGFSEVKRIDPDGTVQGT